MITLQYCSRSLSIDHIAFATLLLQKIFDCRGNEMERGGRVGVVLLIFVCVFTYRLCLVLPQGAACLGGGREFVRRATAPFDAFDILSGARRMRASDRYAVPLWWLHVRRVCYVLH